MINHLHAADSNPIPAQPVGLAPDSNGMVLVVVVILAAVAGILAAGLHFASGSLLKQIRHEILFEKAFYTAEAGIECAKADLRYRAANLTGVLTNNGGVLFGGATNYGAGRFFVWVRNNTNEADPLVDTDNILVIRCTGTVETATRVIEVAVQVVPPVPPESDGALAIYGTNTDLTVSGNGHIDGNDWNVPADFNANGAGLTGTLSTNPASPGVAYSATNTTITTNQDDAITGNPPTTNAVSLFTESYWYNFLNEMMAKATIYSGGSLGTRTAPIVSMLPSGTTTINGNVDGAGILIIPGYAQLRITGTFHYEGIVILEGDGVIDAVDEVFQTGTARIFGAMVCVGGGLDINATGTADIKYSTQALANLANLQLPAPISTLYWQEIKASSADW